MNRSQQVAGPLVPGVPVKLSAHRSYLLFGLTVASNVELPELNSIGADRPSCYIELLSSKVQEPIPDGLFCHHYLPSGKLWRSCAKVAGGFLLRFHDRADFFISSGGERITCHPTCDTPVETVRHLLLDHVIPRCLSLHGKEAFHGSAVATPHGVCGFLGGSGMGKSTLAASLYAAGCTLLGDDCLALTNEDGQMVAIPTYPGLRLWPETVAALFGDVGELPLVCHYSEKRRLAANAVVPDTPLPVRALFVLYPPKSSDTDIVKIERLSTGDSFAALLRTVFRLDSTDPELQARQFRLFGAILAQAPVYRLSYPRDFSILPAVQQRILDTLQLSASLECGDLSPLSFHGASRG